MSEYPRLARPPIVEGLLDLQFVPLEPKRLSELHDLRSFLDDYPTANAKIAFASQIVFSDGGSSVGQAQNVIGYQFTSSDGKRIFQARLDGATLSFLAPYPGFEELEKEARRVWNVFTEHIHPGPIRRIALRYINRLELPLPFNDFKDYLRTAPEVSADAPQKLTEYFMRLVIPDDCSPSVAIVTEIMDPVTSSDQKNLHMTLDIDVFQLVPETGDQRIWEIVSTLREYKDRIFFATITSKLKGLYE